eukprot:11176370-Lingulodinium_polyedra.AAC.1
MSRRSLKAQTAPSVCQVLTQRSLRLIAPRAVHFGISQNAASDCPEMSGCDRNRDVVDFPAVRVANARGSRRIGGV